MQIFRILRIIGCPHNCTGSGENGYKSGWASSEFLRNLYHDYLFLNQLEKLCNLKLSCSYSWNLHLSRSQCVSLLSRLHWLNQKQFKNFMKNLVNNCSVPFLLSFFHSYLGFCSELSNPYSPNPISLPISRKKSPSRTGQDLSPVGYGNNFGETQGK